MYRVTKQRLARKRNQGGFTLAELMFAMLFVSFLLIFGVTVIIQAMQIYSKGLSVRQITQTGRQVTEDLSRSLRYVGETTVVPTQKRFCTGQQSYVWNIGESDSTNQYSDSSAPIRLVQVRDPGGLLCDPSASVPPAIKKNNSREIVSSNLAIQCFTPIQRENRQLIVINLVLSTAGANRPKPAPLASNNIKCPGSTMGIECPPGGDGAYCALGEFTTTVYARNQGG